MTDRERLIDLMIEAKKQTPKQEASPITLPTISLNTALSCCRARWVIHSIAKVQLKDTLHI